MSRRLITKARRARSTKKNVGCISDTLHSEGSAVGRNHEDPKARRSAKTRTIGFLRVRIVIFVIFASSQDAVVAAQSITQRGFIDGSLFLFPQTAVTDSTRTIGDLLIREDVFLKPRRWVQFAGGIELRANSHGQVDNQWRLDFTDRGGTRPLASVRRLSATLTRGAFTVDVGKQFIRWGKADIINPTDRFAPRDFLNVIDTAFLAVTGARAVVQKGGDTFEVVWVPRMTPSRIPLVDQRWTVLPPDRSPVPIVDGGAELPGGSETGVRWGHVGGSLEYSVSFFDGYNHLPNIDATLTTTINAQAAELSAQPGSAGTAVAASIVVRRLYPAIRTYGADGALPTRWFTLKGEASWFTSPSPVTDEYVLYVLQLERQTGEWIIVGGYAGEVVTVRRATLDFAPDRGMTQSLVARASYTIDTNRNMAFETAVRQNGNGMYAKVEYSQARGQHWRATVMGVAITGRTGDFLGQYHRNSHVALALRYSF